MDKIAIIGDEEVSKSLCRALRYVDCLRDILIRRFILSQDIDNAIELLDKSNKKSIKFSLLILANLEEQDNIELIRDIRFSKKKDFDEPGIPIILLSISPLHYDKLSPEQTAYIHLMDYGCILDIPFTIKDLHDCLKRAVYFDKELLEDVRNSFNKSALIHAWLHEMNEDNKIERLERIEAVVPEDYKERIQNLNKNNIDDVRRQLETIKEKIEEGEKREEVRNET